MRPRQLTAMRIGSWNARPVVHLPRRGIAGVACSSDISPLPRDATLIPRVYRTLNDVRAETVFASSRTSLEVIPIAPVLESTMHELHSCRWVGSKLRTESRSLPQLYCKTFAEFQNQRLPHQE